MGSLLLFIPFLVNLIVIINGDDPLGCGGFIKSHVPIEFSKVEVKLLTKGNILKDKITCAPTNGYYFVPIYDKGDYILELEPPAGWSFLPTRVAITIDGKNDACSQGKDIDFVFQGFGITGKVESLGDNDGPEGVEVQLKVGPETRITKTGKDGSFFFTPVDPGTYYVAIYRSKWKIWKGSIKVVVTEGNAVIPPKSLVIQGYDVTGTMVDQGVPIKDTTIVLFHQQGKSNVEVDGCTKGLTDKFNHHPLCYVKTDSQGVFKFATIPNGEYYIKPFYTDDNINYQPSQIEFIVEHNSVVLSQSFEIIGFSVRGSVKKSPNGEPIQNAKIYLNGDDVGRTDVKGSFRLIEIRAGIYKLTAHANGLQFREQTVEITPNTKVLPDLLPYAYEVCGNVLSDKPETITFSKIGSTTFLSTLSEPETGNFCDFLPPGNYEVQVVVSGEDAQHGIQFYPPRQSITVQYDNVYDISFSQLKATIRGDVKCLKFEDCDDIYIALKTRGLATDKTESVTGVQERSFYEFREVYPGAYDVTLLENKFCWQKNKHPIDVNAVQIKVPPFIQIGYSVVFVASHVTQIEYNDPAKDRIENVIINDGRTVHCVQKAGIYQFKLKGCHIYETSNFTFDTTKKQNEFHINAIKHNVSILIQAEKDYGPIKVTIDIKGNKTEKILKYHYNGYRVEFFLGPNEMATLTPKSDILYFIPTTLNIDGVRDCEDLGPKFKAIVGIVFEGNVNPPLEGVQIMIDDDNDETIIITETNDKGHYKIPPLDKTKKYKVTARKESYVIKGPDDKGNFIAHKLAEIVIEVLDRDDGTPLVGTLLSLSGGESYRSNLQTDDNGKIVFTSISPGEYFLRPMMKEYSFEPSSKIISVKEGAVINVRLSGKKVAYSVFGEILSLNGEPENNIPIIANGLNNCSHFSEESTSEYNGKFRIRGLQPYCSYIITINTNNNNNNNNEQQQQQQKDIERSAPSNIFIKNINDDIKNLKLLIFRPIKTMDLLLKVYAKQIDHYKILKIKLIRESPPTTLLYSGKIDITTINLNQNNNYGVIMQLPQIPSDGRTYTLQFESTNTLKWDMKIYSFIANSTFKYFNFELKLKKDHVDQDIKQISIGIVLLLLLILLGIYRFDVVKDYLNTMWELTEQYSPQLRVGSLNKKLLSSDRDYPIDNDDIDQIVQSINAIKKRPKSKKATQ